MAETGDANSRADLLPAEARQEDAARSAGAAAAPGGRDRPRERLQEGGPEVLCETELLALVLRTGARGRSATALARALLDRHGGLRGLAAARLRELAAHPGVGPAKAAALRAAFELGRRHARQRLEPGARIQGPADVHRHFHPTLRDALHERFFVILLDGRHRVIRPELVSQGTLTASLVHPREVFRPALREAAAAVVLVHNHPSGDPAPSSEDRQITGRLARAGELLGIPVLDHVIVAERGYVSLREEGAWEEPEVPDFEKVSSAANAPRGKRR